MWTLEDETLTHTNRGQVAWYTTTRALGGYPPPLNVPRSVAEGSLTLAMLSLAAATARAMSGRGAAPRVSRAALLERSRLRRAPTDIARPFDPLAVVLLGLVQAFRAAVRTNMHCSDCRECAGETLNHH